jgi:hypothetical protein
MPRRLERLSTIAGLPYHAWRRGLRAAFVRWAGHVFWRVIKGRHKSNFII